ncbi:MAG TPA: hypothetical protein H9782_11070 [Candidatus Bariatricus faecipullorum]|nr:hypothetical protein [Candidatus Bariatricus faecipullorum]
MSGVYEEQVENFFCKRTNRGSTGMTEFERSGLDAEKLGWLPSARRRKILENAGLNPDEYDF